MANYQLIGNARGSQHRIPADSTLFERAAPRKDRLVIALGIEEKFALFFDNFHDYEQALLDLTLEHTLYTEFAWSPRVSDMYRIVRRIVNLLSAARLYLDQIAHDLTTLFGQDSDALKQFRSDTSVQYDAKLGYRAMESLRNFIQHRSIPITAISTGWKRSERQEGDVAIHTVNPKLDLDVLDAEGGFKSKVLQDLKAASSDLGRSDQYPLKGLMREYVEGLAAVHAGVQSWLGPIVTDYEAIVNELTSMFISAIGESPTALRLLKVDAPGQYTEHHFFLEMTERINWLARRHRPALHVTSQIISSELG
jgi:hypothetical protein